MNISKNKHTYTHTIVNMKQGESVNNKKISETLSTVSLLYHQFEAWALWKNGITVRQWF